MLTYKASKEIRAYLKSRSKSIGLVPTMGALHSGHLSLVKKACEENDYVVISIYVNPTQFNHKIDLESYPSTPDGDMILLDSFSDQIIFADEKINVIWNATVEEILGEETVNAVKIKSTDERIETNKYGTRSYN